MKSFKVLLSKTSASQLRKLDSTTMERIKEGLKRSEDGSFLEDSVDIKKVVSTRNPALYRMRVGDYRALFFILGDEIRITQIIHRGKGVQIFVEDFSFKN